MNGLTPLIPLRPDTYVKKTLLDVWDEFPLLLGAALVVIASALPGALLVWSGWWAPGLLELALTLFPGLMGLFYVASRVGRGQAAGIRHVLWGARHFYVRGLSLGLLVVVPLSMALGTYDLLSAHSGPPWLWVPLVLQLGVVIAVALPCAHALALLALYDLPITQVLLYAWAATARAPTATIGTTALMFLLGLAVWWTRGGLSPVALAVWTMFAVNLTVLIVSQEQDRGASPVHRVHL
jgi:hypothetical protein